MNPFIESTVARPLADPVFSAGRRPLAAMAAAAVLWAVPASAMDVNQASAEQLKSVRGIGPKTAEIIIQERARGGPYESFSDLSDRVKGIGPKKAEALQRSGLIVGSPPSAPKAMAPAAPSLRPKRSG